MGNRGLFFILTISSIFCWGMHVARMGTLHQAVINGDSFLVRAFLACLGTDINAIDESGFTPLHYAVFNKNLQIFKALLAAGADMYAQIEQGRNVLHYAAEHGLYLPSGLGTTDEEIHNVVRKLTKFI